MLLESVLFFNVSLYLLSRLCNQTAIEIKFQGTSEQFVNGHLMIQISIFAATVNTQSLKTEDQKNSKFEEFFKDFIFTPVAAEILELEVQKA